jgi:hypothetical protein
MPILTWFLEHEFNGSKFLGVCEYGRKNEFRQTLEKLCEVMEWPKESVKCHHSYLNSVHDRFICP